MKITMTAIIERQRVRLYTQKAKKCKMCLYKKNQDTFQKARQFPLRFYIQKDIFMKFLKLAFIYEKHETLRYVAFFIYKKLVTFQKARQFAICFYIQKFGTFALRDFSLNC